MRHFIAIALSHLLIPGVLAQAGGKHVEHQQLAWLCYFNTLKFNDRWWLTTEVQERVFTAPFAQHQFLVRPHLHRDLGSGWDLAPGFCLFLQSPQDPNSSSDLVVPELRPHLEINGKQRTGKVRIGHRFKFEARYFHRVSDGELADGYAFGNFRLRYRIGVDVPLLRTDDGKADRLLLRMSDEVHVNAGGNIVHNSFDQNRLYGGLQYVISSALSVEAGYQYWFQQRASGIDYYARDILRLAVNHRIDLGTKRAAAP